MERCFLSFICIYKHITASIHSTKYFGYRACTKLSTRYLGVIKLTNVPSLCSRTQTALTGEGGRYNKLLTPILIFQGRIYLVYKTRVAVPFGNWDYYLFLMVRDLNYLRIQTGSHKIHLQFLHVTIAYFNISIVSFLDIRSSLPTIAFFMYKFTTTQSPVDKGAQYLQQSNSPGLRTIERASSRELMNHRIRCQLNFHSELKYPKGFEYSHPQLLQKYQAQFESSYLFLDERKHQINNEVE